MQRKLKNLLRGVLVAALAGTAACDDAQPDTPLSAASAVAAANETDAIGTEAIGAVDLRLVMDTITKGMIADSTNDFYRPWSTARNRFMQAVDSVIVGKVAFADSLLDQYFYDVYRVRESTTNDTLVIFRERLYQNGKVRLGWGTYIFNRRPQQRVDIHVNHPISDLHTEDVGIELYRDGRYRWFMVAGAERDANPTYMEADVAHTANTIFHNVAIRVAASNVRALSVHGFDITNDHDSLPNGADLVISNGLGDAQGYPAAFIDLRTRLLADGWEAGLFRHTPGYFHDLGGTDNLQGQVWIQTAGRNRWMHLEIERQVRVDPDSWRLVNSTLRAWLTAHPL